MVWYQEYSASLPLPPPPPPGTQYNNKSGRGIASTLSPISLEYDWKKFRNKEASLCMPPVQHRAHLEGDHLIWDQLDIWGCPH